MIIPGGWCMRSNTTKRASSGLFLAGLVLVFFGRSAEALDFDNAKWIWYSPGAEAALGELPAAVNYMRGSLDVPADGSVQSAEIIATCDNLFVLYLNGKAVGESGASNNVWNQPRRWDVTGWMVPGKNTVAVQAVNTLPGPAGMIFKLAVRLSDGRELTLDSDAAWLCESREQPSWQARDFDDTHWNDARVVGLYGDQPWRKVKIPDQAQPAPAAIGQVEKFAKEALREAARQQRVATVLEQEPSDGFRWPGPIAFVGDDRSLYRPLAHSASSYDSLSVTIFNPRSSRAFPEHDLPAP